MAIQKMMSEREGEFGKIIDYDNRKWREELLPLYEQMATVFRENLWLADAETRVHFGELLKFIDTWHRWLNGALPREVLRKLGHKEAALQPFYEHLQYMHDELKRQLTRGGKPLVGSATLPPAMLVDTRFPRPTTANLESN